MLDIAAPQGLGRVAACQPGRHAGARRDRRDRRVPASAKAGLDGQGDGGEILDRARRTAAKLRRHAVPQQQALIGLLFPLPAWVSGPDAASLRNAIERLGALGHDPDPVQERARLPQGQSSARLVEATNRNLYILSIVTTIFLPMTAACSASISAACRRSRIRWASGTASASCF